MIKLKPLSYFKAVVDHGSVSAAAEALFVAQPPLSRGLHLLEEQWGVKLFERSSRGMTPTEAGNYLYGRAADILQMAQDIDEEMHAFGDGERGVVRIGTVSMGIPRVTRMMKVMGKRSPQLSFSLQQGDTGYLEELLAHRRIDMALVHLPLTGQDGDIQMLPLARSCFRALCLPDSPLAALDILTLRQLADWPLVLMRRKSGFGVYENVLQSFNKGGLSPQLLADSSDVPMIKSLVEQGLAVGLLLMLENEQDWGGLVSRQVPELENVADDLVLIYRAQAKHRSTLNSVITAFTEEARSA